jgi:hypothetical protein
MIRVYADFNAMTSDDCCWLLRHGDGDLTSQLENLGLRAGSHVLLYQDENDFEVVGVLEYRFVPEFASDIWLAKPDWSTLRRI